VPDLWEIRKENQKKNSKTRPDFWENIFQHKTRSEVLVLIPRKMFIVIRTTALFYFFLSLLFALPPSENTNLYGTLLNDNTDLIVDINKKLASEDPLPPVFPDFFHSILMVRNNSEVLLSGPVWYDFQTKKYRLDIKQNRELQSSILRFDLKREYKLTYSLNNKTCVSRNLEGSLPPPLSFDDSSLKYLGVELVWGSLAFHWSITKDGHQLEFWCLKDKTGTPWQLLNQTTQLYTNWQFFETTKPDASVFEPPKGVPCTAPEGQQQQQQQPWEFPGISQNFLFEPNTRRVTLN